MDGECIFCKIANNLIPSFKFYEDNDIIGVLDIYPANIGQAIIFPKKHIEDLENLDDGIIGKMFVLSKYISIILKNKIKCSGFNFIFYSGKVPLKNNNHIALYIIPRFDNDNVRIIARGNLADQNILEDIKNFIIANLGNIDQKRDNKEEKKEEKKIEENKDYEKMLKWLRKNI